MAKNHDILNDRQEIRLNEDGLQIRYATVKDIADIQNLLRITWHHTYDNILGPEKVIAISKLWHSHERLENDITSPDCHFLVMNDKTEIFATVYVRYQGNDVILGRMYVHPNRQGKGYGSELMQAIISAVQLRHGQRISLTVEPRNQSSIRFYEKFGFKIIGTGSCSEVPYDGDPTLIMVRESVSE